MEDSIIFIWLVRCHRFLLTNPTRTDYAKSKKNQETLKKDLMERKTEIRSLYGFYSILSHYRAPFLFDFQILKFATILRNRFGGWFF